ncbi:hypothetical protein H4R18_005907 [Coemansia javaensis]|uniref:Era-type G domain-containing protein n=1 Tax=Coemansia javaensis TaxID=2761396 RepID=A0A9W8H6E0_9FUNG|nr:hypothetical protein H4R18_005907 [Coemansia javaensis]
MRALQLAQGAARPGWRAPARTVHGTAAAATVLRRIQRVLEQARPGTADKEGSRASEVASGGASQAGADRQGSSGASQRRRPEQRRDGRRDLPPAESWQAMPRSFGAFEQPADAEVARVVLLGVANAGKSTLVNRLVGSDVSIVSPRPQTTRARIMAAATAGRKQLVFLDTPGVVSRQALRRVARSVVTAPWATLAEADCAVLLLDAFKITHKSCETENYLFKHLAAVPALPVLLAVNKIDLVEDHARLLARAREYQARCPAAVGAPLLISARDDVGVAELKALLLARTRPGRWEVPAGVASDMSDLVRVEELIRAEWFARMSGHMPYAVRQRNVGWHQAHGAEPASGADPAQSVLTINQELIVPSAGEAVILVGAGGRVVRDMAQCASRTISAALGRPTRLHLQVVVQQDPRRRK